MTHSREAVAQAVRSSWSKETSASPDEWTPDTPALGQCVPTSLVVQDLLGGDLERLATQRNGSRETHYRNILPDGETLDVSRDQYPEDQQFVPAPVEGDVREYVLGNENTRRRYALLRELALRALEQ
ncbi:MAG: hypothetical protein WBO49_05095 [Candidatus Saccharimonas sp.]